MKPDAIGGQANMLLSARLIRGKPAGETTPPIYRTALPLREAHLRRLPGGPWAGVGCDRLSGIREQRWYNSNRLPPHPRHRFVGTQSVARIVRLWPDSADLRAAASWQLSEGHRS